MGSVGDILNCIYVASLPSDREDPQGCKAWRTNLAQTLRTLKGSTVRIPLFGVTLGYGMLPELSYSLGGDCCVSHVPALQRTFMRVFLIVEAEVLTTPRNSHLFSGACGL